MKSIKNIIICLFAIAGSLYITSCKKVLEQEPVNTFDVLNRYETIEDFQFSLNGTYGLFRQGNYYGNGSSGSFSTLPDMMSDNLLETTASLVNYATLANWVYAANTGNIQNTWLAAYVVVSQANLTLNGNGKTKKIDDFINDPVVGAQAKRIKGQALAIRALVHFDLMRYFAPEFGRNSTALGVPYVKQIELTNPKNLPKRLTVKETYDAIEVDLLEALNLLTGYTSGNRYNIDFVGVHAILSRMYLYAGEDTKAIQYASPAITARPLATITQFPSIWKDETTADVIWRCSFNAGEGNPGGNLYFASGNRNSFRMHSSVLALYSATDTRLSAFTTLVNSGSSFTGAPRRVVTKFWGKGSFRDNIVDWKSFRTSEQVLIRAEAYARRNSAGDLALAEADLNSLKSTRITGYTPVTGLTQTAILSEIANERRRELFGEGHRWFDIKRTTKTIDRNPDCASTAAAAGTVCTLASNSRSWAWPIPQAEIDINTNMAGQQNTGY
jgi:starch-binding outer membrane protein, SusD/RagB family